MLRDVFYIVTGVKTDDGIVSLEEKSSQTDGIPLSENEELGWCPWCPMTDSMECEMGVCEHFTGLISAIMRELK